MMHSPAATICTAVPTTEQTAGVVEVNATGAPPPTKSLEAFEEALSDWSAPPKVMSAGCVKVIVFVLSSTTVISISSEAA